MRAPVSVVLTPFILVAALLSAALPAAADESGDDALRALLRRALDLACPAQPQAGALAAELGGLTLLEPPPPNQAARGLWRAVYGDADGRRLDLARVAPGGILRRFTATWETPVGDGVRPAWLLVAGGDCAPLQARRIVYDAAGRAARLEELGPDLVEVVAVEPLNPPVPPGADPGGVTVALVDAGLAYTLPAVAARLARDGQGRALGYDFWDLDDRPWDGDTAASPFFPQRHGTPVASVLLREAPEVRIVPFRYPRPDMARMADLVAAAEAAGADIVALPMGSRRQADWAAFAAAAAARPQMLFVVSAGNDGRDIDADPLYPASLPLDNLLVVTSADDFGRLARGSNWGVASVDLMLPAENQPVTDWRGASGRASGSSYAVPRVAALAARLKARNPDWRGPELKAAILARAVPSPFERNPVVKHGWLVNPADDG